MPFYMVVNNKLIDHEFDYLEKTTGRRLDPTLSPKIKKIVRADKSSDSWVTEIMSKNLFSLSPDDLVNKAIKMLKKENIHHIPIVEDLTLVGMVSDRDILWLNKMEMDKNASLRQFMSNIILVCHEETPVDHLAHVFYREQINGMPVINDQLELAGMVTHHDILKWVYDS